MRMKNSVHDITELEVPLPEDLKGEFVNFWEKTFGTNYAAYNGVFNAEEIEFNHDIVYMIRKGNKLGGTCHLTHSIVNPELGGLGEVVTDPEFSNLGIAGAVCKAARDEFQKHGGKVIFLGTGNPVASRVYFRLGWRKLAGAPLMACVTSGEPPEDFLVDYFRKSESVIFTPASCSDRIPMIPLIVVPHDWQVLDANTGMYSTRYVDQISCMGLYFLYEALQEKGLGTWFGARSVSGILTGLSTVRINNDNHQCQVDGFTHHHFINAWEELMMKAIKWGFSKGAPSCFATVSAEDIEKKSLFESLGFNEIGTGDDFDINGRKVPSFRMEMSVNA